MEISSNIRKLADDKSIKLFFVICWVTYFSTYIGRLNFTASMADMIEREGFTKSQMGLVAAAFFLAYGIGQFASGILGDKVNPRRLIFTGVAGSAAVNLIMGISSTYRIMVVLWFVNGLLQSLTWSPISRIVTDRLPEKRCVKAFVDLSTTVPVGTLLTYYICSLSIKYLNWRVSFYFASIFMMAVALIWNVTIKKLEDRADRFGVIENMHIHREKESGNNQSIVSQSRFQAGKIIFGSGLIFILLAAMLHGILKDGIMSWVPTYLTEGFKTGVAFSVQLAMLLPVVNLLGVYLSSYLNKRLFKNELITAGCFFVFTVIALMVLVQFGSRSLILSVAMLMVITSSMLGVNTMLVSLVPLHFKRFGKVSTVCGALNSTTYLGSAVSSYGFGAMAQKFGWAFTRVSWFFLAALGLIFCLAVGGKWHRFSVDEKEAR